MTSFKTLDDLPADLTGKVALVRVDLNLPMADGVVTDDTRVRASAPTILELADKGAKVLLLAHFGRPKGEKVSTMSVSMTISRMRTIQTGRKCIVLRSGSGVRVDRGDGCSA